MKVKNYGQRKLKRILIFVALLRQIAKGKSQVDIAKGWKWSKQKTNYWVKQLQKEAFIQEEVRSSTKIYGVTSKGKKFLTWSEKVLSREVFVHSLGLKFPILESSPEFDALEWREIRLKNWIKKVLKYHDIEGSFSIERNPKNLIVWCQERSGVNPYQLFFESLRDILRFADSLQTKYCVRLGCPSLFKKPHFGIVEPLLGKVNKVVQVSGAEEWTDESPAPGSVEFFDPRRIIRYLRMPDKLDHYENILTEMAEQMKAFGEGMNEHLKLISALHELALSLKKVADSLLKTSRSLDQE